MIDVKPPEETLKINFTEEQEQVFKEFVAKQNSLLLAVKPSEVSVIDTGVSNELHELNKTLKDILREMRRRKI